MATVEVVSAKTAIPEDPNEASLKAQETTEEVVKTPTTAPGPISEQPKEEEPAPPEVNDSVEVKTKDVVEEAKVVTVTEEETQKKAAEPPVVEEIKDNADDAAAEVQAPAAAEPENEVQKEDIVQEKDQVAEAEAKGKVETETPAEKKDDEGAVDREAPAEKIEKVDTEASDEKSEEKVSTEAAEAEKSEDGTEAPTEKTE